MWCRHRRIPGTSSITQKVEQLVESSGIGSGTAFIITAHTTTGITVNEALECLQSDMCEAIAALAPEMRKYSHARMLHSYGQSADNAPSHIRAMLTNNHAVFPVKNGKLHRGKARSCFWQSSMGRRTGGWSWWSLGTRRTLAKSEPMRWFHEYDGESDVL